MAQAISRHRLHMYVPNHALIAWINDSDTKKIPAVFDYRLSTVVKTPVWCGQSIARVFQTKMVKISTLSETKTAQKPVIDSFKTTTLDTKLTTPYAPPHPAPYTPFLQNSLSFLAKLGCVTASRSRACVRAANLKMQCHLSPISENGRNAEIISKTWII